MELLNIAEWLSLLPAEAWLIPPVVILTGVFGIAITRRQRLVSAWEEIARRTGLRIDSANPFNSPTLNGEYRGRLICMLTISRRSTWRRGDATRVTVQIDNPAFVTLKLWKQDALDKLLELGGMHDVKVGDEAFDTRFFVHAGQPDAVRMMFAASEALRRALQDAGIYYLKVINADLWADVPRVLREPAHAVALLDAAADLADAIAAIPPSTDKEVIRA